MVASAAACATLPAGDPAASSAPAVDPVHSAAVLFVERRAAPPGSSVQSHVGARFVQYTGVSYDALPDLLGVPSMPSSRVGGCIERGDAALDGARAEVRLLDVGTLDVRAGDRSLRLEPRRFPDLWNVVSGVIYSSDGELPASAWRFSAAGTPGTNGLSRVHPFEVEAPAPDDLATVTIAEQGVGEGSSVALPRRGFGVRWQRGDHDDAVSVVFEQSSGDGSSRVVCTAHDEGSLDIEGLWAERINEMAVRGGATVTVHRLRARPFALAGVEQAQVLFDLVFRARATAGD